METWLFSENRCLYFLNVKAVDPQDLVKDYDPKEGYKKIVEKWQFHKYYSEEEFEGNDI